MTKCISRSFDQVSNNSDSIWLTAYVVKCFGKAKNLIPMDDKPLHDALKFLKDQQNPNGSFDEYGRVSYYKFKSETSAQLSLTAFTAIAFLESKDHVEEFNSTITKALNFIEKNVLITTDDYAMAIALYALSLSYDEDKYRETVTKVSERLVKSSHQSSTSGQKMMYWKHENALPLSARIEIAAYVVLAYIKLGLTQDAVPIARWMVSKRNPYGGFSSTQDTVIGLQALTEMSLALYSSNFYMNVTLSFGESSINLRLNQTNRLTSHRHFIKPKGNVRVTVVGNETASVQITHSYHQKINQVEASFKLDVTWKTKANILDVHIRTSFIPQDNTTVCMMPVMVISLPSGYVIDTSFDFNSLSGIKVNSETLPLCTNLKYLFTEV